MFPRNFLKSYTRNPYKYIYSYIYSQNTFGGQTQMLIEIYLLSYKQIKFPLDKAR